MNFEKCIEFLREEGCNESVIKHSISVFGLSLYIASRIALNNYKINFDLLAEGALLHDIGRSKTHSVKHGYIGAEIIRRKGLGEKLALIVERHVGAGITADEAKRIGLPEKNYIPETIEEKIICYADKLVFSNRIGTVKEVVNLFKKDLGENHPAIKRFLALHKEIKELIGEKTTNPKLK